MNENGKTTLEKKKFQSRMGLAYISMIAMIILTILLWFFVPSNRLEVISGLSPYVYFAFTSIIGAAMGFKTYSPKT